MMEHEAHETVVFDLDGTLVHLGVDWATVASEVAETLRERGVTPPDTLWGMLETSEETDNRAAVERVIADHERDGAHDSERLAAADTIPSCPVGVCSLNCEDAVHIAIEKHDIEGVSVVIGRDSVTTRKPDPEPLLETVRRLDGDPSTTLFIGDTKRDEKTAERADTDYVDISEWLRAYA
ncbi:MAG: phosphoglycolate phosphatase [Natronomonas sp.]|jgi:phosphoglycolate phosphatase|uniref:HAD family hydrolase n=1 Tax=Natronomonas sp. TaxID=2184060 RepID=UPI003989F2F5